MLVRARSRDDENRVTMDAGVELTNVLDEGGDVGELRRVLVEHEFVRASRATDDELGALPRRFAPVAAIIRGLPGAPLDGVVGAVNRQLGQCRLAPSVVAHDGAPLHIHWTSAESPFAGQVVVDVLMALGQLLCEHGTERFGRCGAEGCDRLFYDATKNRSRRFCSDPRCASRTHTAEHRARRRGGQPERASRSPQ